MSGIINFLIGIPLLIWGRKLFWLFVGAVGFIAGFYLANRYVATDKEWIILLVSLGLGLLGVMLALAVQKTALTLAGFLAGMYLVYLLFENTRLSLGDWNWVVIAIGGVIGSLLILSVFDWAIILLSSLVGASMITQTSLRGITLEPTPRMIIFALLLLTGIL